MSGKETEKLSLSKTCKECSKTFETIQSCLAHEMVAHVKLEEQKQPTRKRPRNIKLKLVESDDFKELREKATEMILRCSYGQEYIQLCKVYQPVSENLFDVYEMIVDDLKKVLNPHGNYNIYPFGSAVTGTTFKNSDIDLYIEPPQGQVQSHKKVFSKIYNLLLPSKDFSKGIAIRQARVPIIKIVHNKTGYPLDINTSSKHGVLNSEFLEKIIKSDTRFQFALLTIRIWAKYRDINKLGGMNSYCLTLMFFFYLQQLNIVPPFRNLINRKRPVLYDNKNFGFDYENLIPPSDGKSVRELVSGFFEYYYNFDYEHRIISLYFGYTITPDFITNSKKLFPQYHSQLKYLLKQKILDEEDEKVGLPLTIIVVQDPFCLYQNTSKSVNPMLLMKIKKHMELTNTISKQSANLSDQRWLVRVLFEVFQAFIKDIRQPMNQNVEQNIIIDLDDDEQSTQSNKMRNRKKNKDIDPSVKPQNQQKFLVNLFPLEQQLFYIRNHLSQDRSGKVYSQSDIIEFWSEKVVEYLKLILTEILALDVEEQEENFEKTPKSDSQTDVHSDKLNFKAKITSNVDVWSNRVLTKKTSFGKLLTEQIQLTQKFKENRDKESKFKPLSASIDIAILKGQSLSVTFSLTDDPGSNSSNMFDFFTKNVRILLKGYLENNLVKSGVF